MQVGAARYADKAATHYDGADSSYARLDAEVRAPAGYLRYDLSSLSRIGGGGAAMPEAVAQKMPDTFGLPYIEGHGLAETAAPTHVNPVHRPEKQCAGIPFVDADSRVPFTRPRLTCPGGSLRPHRHAGGAMSDRAGVFETHEDAVRRWIESDITRALYEDPKRRRLIGIDRQCHRG